MKKWLCWMLTLIMALTPVLALGENVPGNPETIPAGLEIDWNARYTFAELEAQMDAVAQAYPQITEKFEIGRSWQERALWCVKLTDETIPNEDKIGVAVFGNIHGGERESASCAMYFMWWLALNAEEAYVADLLDNYVIYVVPVINPDGYEQSFVINTRQNLRPRDLNGDGVPFSDPYTDIDGDGYIAYLITGTAEDAEWLENATSVYSLYRNPKFMQNYIGRESPDWDKNGVLADDPRNSGIDMNRTFDYQWNRFDIETVGSESGVIGTNSFASSGPDAASEPEIQAVQNFLIREDIRALASLHTGIQCVLYPWCYRPFDDTDEELVQMKAVAEKMTAAFQNTTGRGFYSKSSWEDYPTSAEMIDYAYGRLNIHAYTIEVYSAGKSGNIEDCLWENELPAATAKFYTAAEVAAMGLDLASLGKADAEGVWFFTPGSEQMVDKAPTDQDIMVQGCRDALLQMIEAEPFGEGKIVPYWLQ